MTLHGFRAMARTILDEVLGFRPDFIEHQLAHAVRDPNGRAYNRTAFLPERRVMMQERASGDDEVRDLGSHRILHAQTETRPGTEAPDGAVTLMLVGATTPTRGPSARRGWIRHGCWQSFPQALRTMSFAAAAGSRRESG